MYCVVIAYGRPGVLGESQKITCGRTMFTSMMAAVQYSLAFEEQFQLVVCNAFEYPRNNASHPGEMAAFGDRENFAMCLWGWKGSRDELTNGEHRLRTTDRIRSRSDDLHASKNRGA